MDLSRARQEIAQMHQRQRKLLDVLLDSKPFAKGSLYLLKRRCGNPNCRCATRDELHKSWVLTYKAGGRSRLEYLRGSGEDVGVLEKLVARWKQFRGKRAGFTKLHRRIMDVLYQMEQDLESRGQRSRQKHGSGGI